MTPVEVDAILKPLSHKDLRVQTRARGLSPAGGIEQLRDRLKAAMYETGDFSLRAEDGTILTTVQITAGASTHDQKDGKLCNNYARPNGQQNVGNMLSERPSSRVMAPPGGVSQISFGDCEPTAHKFQQRPVATNPLVHDISNQGSAQAGTHNNNYHRPGGQNVGNFLTDRNSSRVLAPPGGVSQIHFG